MSLDHAATKPHERLAAALAVEMDAVNVLIRDRMASEHAPRIPEVTAHLVEAGGKRLRPMLTLAAANRSWGFWAAWSKLITSSLLDKGTQCGLHQGHERTFAHQ
jgi:hypothetical protein